MKKIVFLLLTALICSLSAQQYLVRFKITGSKNTELVKEFNNRGEDIAGRGKDFIDLVISKDRLPEFAHLKPEIIFDHDPVEPLRKKGDLGAYHTYYEMLTEMQSLAADNPGIMKIINLGPAWEKANAVQGADRDIIAIKISDNVDVDENEPQILLDADHHAREIITPEIIIDVVKKLIVGYNSNDPEMKYYINEREIYLVPIVNPDGHNYVANVNGMWRKNRHKYGSYYGADLNRNYGYQWGGAGASSSPYSDTYRGSEAFSEPETAIMRDFAKAKNFVFNISYHSYSNLILFPWGYDYLATNPDRAVYQQLADSMSAVNGYATGAPGELLYDASGGSFDWHYGAEDKAVALAFSPEIGTSSDGFAPPESRITDLLNENVPNCFFLIRQADDPYLKRPYLMSNSYYGYGDGTFSLSASFDNSTSLDSVVLNCKPDWQNQFSASKMQESNSNSFTAAMPAYNQSGNVSYYYTAWFTFKSKVYKIDYPQFGAQKPLVFNYSAGNAIGSETVPAENRLSAYPNPFNSTTRISLNLTGQEKVNISLFDVQGREIKKIAANLSLNAGHHSFDLKISLAGGIYFVKATGEKMQPILQKITYLK